MDTKAAFAELIAKRNWYAGLPITKEAAWSVAKRFKDGEKISSDKLEEVLEMAGYKVICEKQYAAPDSALATGSFDSYGSKGFRKIFERDVLLSQNINTADKMRLFQLMEQYTEDLIEKLCDSVKQA